MTFAEIRALIERLLPAPIDPDPAKTHPLDLMAGGFGTILVRLTETIEGQFAEVFRAVGMLNERIAESNKSAAAPAPDAPAATSDTATAPAPQSAPAEAPAPSAPSAAASEDDGLAFIVEGMSPEEKAAFAPPPPAPPTRPQRRR